MKIAHLTPGSGDNFYCENCLRDAALVRALRSRGHDVIMIPLYLPLQADTDIKVSNAPVFFGGVNVYLQQKFEFFRKSPRWLDKLFDSQSLLRWAGKKAGMVDAKELFETTISMLQGEDGCQKKELDRLVEWLCQPENKPDLICFSNALLIGSAGYLKDNLKIPLASLLQDEDEFVDKLPKAYAEQIWDLMSEKAKDIDTFISVSEYFTNKMRNQLKLESEKIFTVYTGIEFENYKIEERQSTGPVLGYLSRMSPEKGLDVLADAFIDLKKESGLENLKLKISGGLSGEDNNFVKGVKSKLKKTDVFDDVEFLESFNFKTRLKFLNGLSVLSVPQKMPSAYGLFVLEALALGVAVLEPDIGVFPEVLSDFAGSMLYHNGDSQQYKDKLKRLLLDKELAAKLATQGRELVANKFNIEKTAEQFEHIYSNLIKIS